MKMPANPISFKSSELQSRTPVPETAPARCESVQRAGSTPNHGHRETALIVPEWDDQGKLFVSSLIGRPGWRLTVHGCCTVLDWTRERAAADLQERRL